MGSRSTQETKIPAYIEEAGKKALERAQQIQDLGYVPYMGPEIAEISETERALNRNVGAMASAFGLEGPAPLTMGDAAVTSAGGVSGYSSYPAYMSALQRLQEQRPDQYEFFAGLGRFDPITGAENPNYSKSQSIFGTAMGNLYGGMGNYDPKGFLGGGGDDGPNMREFMEDRRAESARRADPRSSSPRPVLRGESTGGLFSGMREAKNKVLDTLGVI